MSLAPIPVPGDAVLDAIPLPEDAVDLIEEAERRIEAFYDLMAATDKVGMLLDLPAERMRGEHHLPMAAEGPAELEAP